MHPFHPWNGQVLPVIVRKRLWGKERVTVQLPDGTYRSVPTGWTDWAAVDAYVSIGGGRSLFRVVDLLELVRLVRGGQR